MTWGQGWRVRGSFFRYVGPITSVVETNINALYSFLFGPTPWYNNGLLELFNIDYALKPK